MKIKRIARANARNFVYISNLTSCWNRPGPPLTFGLYNQMANVKIASKKDGGYGWVIVGASFLVHFILLGLTRSFGALYISLLRVFDSNATKVASLNAVFNAARLGSGELLKNIIKLQHKSLYGLARLNTNCHVGQKETLRF